ncbi:MAG: CHASE2 domain-containing protein [Methylomicrobium sp.]|nr:CHASE2 domain-containing protein [Methylomicrobium sp.]
MEQLARFFRFPGLGLALSLSLLAALLLNTGALSRIDNLIYDSLLRIWPRPASSEIVLIEIDEHSLHQLGRWPWSRRIHANLINALGQQGAAAIGLDIIFAEPDANDPESDSLLAQAIDNNGHVILPVLPEATGLDSGSMTVTLPLAQLAIAAAGLGHVDVELDKDGLVRSAYLEAGYGKQKWRSFASVVLSTGRKDITPLSDGESRPLSKYPEPGIWWRNQRIPVPFATALAFQRLSYVDVLQGKTGNVDLHGKLVLVGASAAGLAPRFPSPLSGESKPMSGLEFHAQILNAGLQGFHLTRINSAVEKFLTLILVFTSLMIGRFLSPNRPFFMSFSGICLSGAISLILLFISEIWYSPSPVVFVMALSYPLQNWRQLEHIGRTLLSEQRRSAATLDAMSDAIIITDRLGCLEYLNPNAELLTGFSLQEARDKSIDVVLACLDMDQLNIRNPSQLLDTGSKSFGLCILTTPNDEYTIRLSSNRIQMTENEPEQIMIVLSDITETLKIGRSWQYLATHDKLTGLPNRAMMEDLLEQSLVKGKQVNSHFAICFIDLDGFKSVNNALGHTAGDFLLKEVAKRLKINTRNGDTVALWGGDVFVIFFDRVPNRDMIATLTKKILSTLCQPYPYLRETFTVTPSIGISLFPDDGKTAQQLLNKANAAMYSVKKSGSNDFSFYSSQHLSTDEEHVMELSSEDLVHTLSAEDKAKLDAIRLKTEQLKSTVKKNQPQDRLKGFLSPFKKTK